MQAQKKIEKAHKKKRLPPEPADGDPNAALIALRYPHDGNILKRRLLKTEKIQVSLLIKLIEYINTLFD